MKQLDQSRKTILLTGASGKIGGVLTDHLLKNNYNVLALCKHQSSAEKLTQQFSSDVQMDHLSIFTVDLCQQTDRDCLADELSENNIYLYGFIHNARSLDTLKQDATGYINNSHFMAEFELGVYAPYDLIWQLANKPNINLQRIINISSIYGVVATNVHLYESKESRLPLHYGVVKSALIHLTKELAVRLAEKNMTINAVSYGGVEGRVDAQFQKKYAQLCPQATMLKHEDLAGAVNFLLSDSAKSITGHNLLVDGGWTIW